MARLEELRLAARVARMYYSSGLRQPEIAAQLDISQARVSRLLKRAHDEQIVRITVTPPRGTYDDLEDKLQARYSLKLAIVVDCPEDDDDAILADLGSAAAFYVETTLASDELVGISSWSSTLLAMVDAMHPMRRPVGARVLQILGGMGSPAAEAHASHLTQRLAELINGESLFLPAPGVAGSSASAAAFLHDPFVAQAVKRFDSVTLALVGVGSLEPSRLLASSGNAFSARELEALRRAGAVGDLCLRFFDAEGQPVPSALQDRVIGMTLQRLRKVKRSVGIAGGRRKLAAIRGALNGRLINVLITDRFTAERLLGMRKSHTGYRQAAGAALT